MVRLRFSLKQFLHRGQEVVSHGAADTAIGKLNDIIFATARDVARGKHITVNANITKFVHDQGKALTIGLFQQITDQRCFTSTKKACDHCGGNACCNHDMFSFSFKKTEGLKSHAHEKPVN